MLLAPIPIRDQEYPALAIPVPRMESLQSENCPQPLKTANFDLILIFDLVYWGRYELVSAHR